jgi:polyribonucleotide nucleotidyltransferase
LGGPFVGRIEDVINRGDVLDVIAQEVDKDRGRIGLKLVAKHEDGSLVQPEVLIERAKDAPERPREERPPRRDGGDRGRGRGGRGGRGGPERS